MFFKDQLGREIALHYPPKRIISLVPSQTELLFYLGLSESIVGVTKFCIHPREVVATKRQVGGTKNFWLEVIDEIQPDLIIGNKEENYQEGIEFLSAKYPVWMSDIASHQEALQMIEGVGEIVGALPAARDLISEIELSLKKVIPRKPSAVVYMIWKSPWMAAGKETFIDSWLKKLGLINAITEARYPTLSTNQLQKVNPPLILLSSEPYPFQQKHIQELQDLLPQSKILLVDGEMFSWYGSRMLQAPAYFNSLGF